MTDETQTGQAPVLAADVHYSYDEILDMLELHSSVIMEMFEDDVPDLKAALAVRKSRRSKALRDKNIPAEDKRLSYQILSRDRKSGFCRLKVDLSAKSGITVRAVQLPEEF